MAVAEVGSTLEPGSVAARLYSGFPAPTPLPGAGTRYLDQKDFVTPGGDVIPAVGRTSAILDDLQRSDQFIGRLDHAFTDLETDAAGTAVLRLTDPSGVGVEVTWGAECPWVQVYTGDKPDGPANPAHRNGVAVEPMTCAPDAFNAGSYDYDAGLLVLEPGAEFSASWRIAAI